MIEESVTSTGRGKPSRDGKGKFRRDLEHVERDARACSLRAQGWTLRAIATELGYADEAHVSRGIDRVLVETARRNGSEELRELQLAEMAELRKKMWQVVNSPPPLADRLGRPVLHDGAAVPDVSQQVAAAAVIIRAGERIARLRGLDAPRKSVTANIGLGDIEAMVVAARAELEAEEHKRGFRAVPGVVEPADDDPGEVLD